MVAKAQDKGAIVLRTVGKAADARRAIDCGVDVVGAQGGESGGHVRGSAAVLALGASSAWVGTRCLDSEEVERYPDYQQRIFEASENDTGYLENLFDVYWPDAPHRVLRNSTVDAWGAAGRPPSGERSGEGELVANSLKPPV